MGSKVTAILVWVSALFMYPSVVVAEKLSTINLPAPNTAIASEMYDLHLYVMYICVVIFIGVFGTMFYSVVNHRKSKGYKAANFHHSTTVEIIWTAVPVLILIGMGYPATKTVVDMKDTSAPEITIKATGYQWMWGYDYLTGEGEGISFFSRSSTPREQIRNEAPKGEHYILEVDNNVVVPVGKKVRILTTANDVIHAWSVQQLGVKQDAIPGYIRDTWFKAEKPGIYRGVCSELCGKEHAYMPIVVEVMEQEKYTQWVAAQAQTTEAAAADANKEYTMDELKAKGEKVYAGMCAACHQATGKGIPGTFPALDGSKIATGPKADHINIVVNGKDGSAMSSYKHLSDLDLAAVITYERNSWSSKTDIVQPSEIKAFRN